MIGDFAIDFGFVLAGLVVLIVLYVFNPCFLQWSRNVDLSDLSLLDSAAYNATSGTSASTNLTDGVWRISLALGLLPPLIVFYARYKMINST